jgi:hypothetical protein
MPARRPDSPAEQQLGSHSILLVAQARGKKAPTRAQQRRLKQKKPIRALGLELHASSPVVPPASHCSLRPSGVKVFQSEASRRLAGKELAENYNRQSLSHKRLQTVLDQKPGHEKNASSLRGTLTCIFQALTWLN